jgi:hypothetical protein
MEVLMVQRLEQTKNMCMKRTQNFQKQPHDGSVDGATLGTNEKYVHGARTKFSEGTTRWKC